MSHIKTDQKVKVPAKARSDYQDRQSWESNSSENAKTDILILIGILTILGISYWLYNIGILIN